MLKDDSLEVDNSGAVIKASSTELGLRAAPFFSSYLREKLETPGSVDAPTNTNLPIDPLDRTFPADVARIQQHSRRVVSKVDRRLDPVANPLNAATPRSLQQGNARIRATALDEREVKILLTRSGWEKAMKIRCAVRKHSCPRASWGTQSDCCRS